MKINLVTEDEQVITVESDQIPPIGSFIYIKDKRFKVKKRYYEVREDNVLIPKLEVETKNV